MTRPALGLWPAAAAPASGASIDFLAPIDIVYQEHGTQAQGPALPGGGSRPTSLRPGRRALLRESADTVGAAEEARAVARRAADRAHAQQRVADRGRAGD